MDLEYSKSGGLSPLSSTTVFSESEHCTSVSQECFQEGTVLFLSSEESNVSDEVTALKRLIFIIFLILRIIYFKPNNSILDPLKTLILRNV